MANPLTVFRVEGLPDFQPGDDLASAILARLDAQQEALEEGDILVIAHKVVSKTEGDIIDMATVTPSDEARKLADQVHKDPRKVEVILNQSRRLVRVVPPRDKSTEGLLIAEHRLGFICANAAVDESNADQPNQLITLPQDPDASAQRLCQTLQQATGVRLGIVISDTFGRPWRMGQVNVAIGLAQVPAQLDLRGQQDGWGHTLRVTTPAFADELAAASGLLMGKADKSPAIIFRGLDWPVSDSQASALVRPPQEDLFR